MAGKFCNEILGFFMALGGSSVAGGKVEILGQALRKRRKELDLTMQAVADAAGLSVGFISQVERGLTVTSLAEITRVLGVPMGQFLDQPDLPAPPAALTRQGERRRFSIAASGVSFERLSTRFQGSRLTSVIVHEPPGDRREPTSHRGEEMIYVVSGALTAIVDGQTTILEAGDSIHFDSRRPHTAWNHTAEHTTVLWCGTVDVFGNQGPDPIHRARAPEP